MNLFAAIDVTHATPISTTPLESAFLTQTTFVTEW